MKKLLVGLALAVLAIRAEAGQFELISCTPTNSLIGTNTFFVTNAVPHTGRIRSLSAASAGGGCTVTVTTVSGIGSSRGSAKTIFGPQVVLSGGVVTNFGTVSNYASDVFIGEDYLVYRFDNAAITSSVTPSVGIINEQ